MLSAEENELLTRVGPGTLMGNLLRRYWTPACLSLELPAPDCPPVRLRIYGESLVAFRETTGKVGLVAENCPHRGASVYFGRNEDCGLRCVYHGWKFDVDGNCVDMPNEPAESNFKTKVKIPAYPTHESGGIVWTYMGPKETMPPFRDFGTESLSEDQQYATKEHIDCNWVQSLDGDLDSAHISHLHQYFAIDDIPDDGSDHPGYPSGPMSSKIWRYDRAPRLEVQDEWYGYRYAALRRTPNGHLQARISAYIMPFSALIASAPFSTRQLAIVPSDDENTERFSFTTQPRPNPRNLGGAPFSRVPNYPYRALPAGSGIVPREYTLANDYKQSREAQRTVSFTGIEDFRSHDLMVTESMGRIYDRTQEHLGTTDVAVIRMHDVLLSAAKALAEGREPPALGGGDFRSIRAADKILEAGEDWRVLGTDDDPVVQEAMLSLQPGGGGQ
jgi:nitrite reductase/ring-hydroxylating ferredoxin subunit